MDNDIQLILGNSNKRFSGVTSTMLQVIEHQKKIVSLAVLGAAHLPSDVRALNFKEFLKITKGLTSSGKHLVFHARRNDEMIQALIAKRIFNRPIKIAFTSTAQRQHSKFTKWLMDQMDSIITTSNATNNYLEPQSPTIIPHGIDTTRYQPAKNRSESWKSLGYPGSRGIGIFGRIRPSKGTDIFIDAMIQHLKGDSESTVLICGETTAKYQKFQTELQQKIDAANLSERILFIGSQPFDALPKLFNSLSVVVAASRNEGFGLTVLEAMASGTPVVATEAGAWKDIVIENETGFCVPCSDSSAVATGVEKILKADVDAMGQAARKHIEQNFTANKEAETLTEHLLSLT